MVSEDQYQKKAKKNLYQESLDQSLKKKKVLKKKKWPYNK
jgi:hypothetical protein